jgi:hypothetical protein
LLDHWAFAIDAPSMKDETSTRELINREVQ